MYVFFLRRQVVVPDRDKKVVRTHQSPLSPPPILPKNDCCKGGSCFFLVADELAAIAAIDQEEVGTHDGTSTRQKDDKNWIPACAAERPSEYTPRIQEHPRGDGTKGLGGEGDPQGTAETDEMPIHELAPVVRMEGDDLPRIPAETRLQGSDHIDLCFRPDGPRFRPSRAPIRDGQGPVEISHCSLSIMTHQVHGQGTRGSTPRLGPKGSGGGSMHVWMGILPPRGVLRVWEMPWRTYLLRSPARSLPMVAGLICRRSLRVSSLIGRCP